MVAFIDRRCRMKIFDFEQYSPEWWNERRGLPTASKFDTLITPGGAPSKQCRRYMCELIAESHVHEDEDAFEPNEWMLRGLALEDEARKWLAFDRGHEIRQVGLIKNDEETLGASPDGLIDDVGMGWANVPLEIKCPKGSTHIAYMLDRKLPDTYKPQVHGQMILTDSDVAIFLSYHPEFAPVVVEVKRDQYTAKLEAALDKFVQDLSKARGRLKL
jgi:hypothetical protein